MAHTLDFDFEPVFQFVKDRLPGFARTEGMVAIGLRNEGHLVAGVIYEGINGVNGWMHVAAVPGRQWLTKRFLLAAFRYPFVVCGLRRVSAYVNASNHPARIFDEALGFKEEARLQGAAQDGGDVIIYAMWRKDFRYVNKLV